MSEITLTLIRYRGNTLPLGHNVAVKLLLDRSKPKKTGDGNRLVSVARELWVRSFLRPRAS
jgi:hypothetical protein